jgi:Tfp pilus assembly protein PilF
MEVAVSRIHFLSLISLALGVSLLAGCAEPLTYSQDFKREGLRQYNTGDYLSAAGSFEAAAKQDPTDYHTQYYLGRCYEQTGEYQLAMEAYRLCLKLRPIMPAGRADVATRERTLSRLAILIAHHDTTDSEINALQQQAVDSQSGDDYRLVARVFALRGDADTAVDCYRRAFARDEENFDLAKEYGLYLVKIDQTTAAATVLRKAWALNSSDAQVVQTLRGLGVTDAQLVGSSTTIEQAPEPVTGQSAWDAQVSPRD